METELANIVNDDMVEEIEITKEEYSELLNLLALIHRDGGHHTAKVGLLQSILDAKDFKEIHDE